MCGWTSHQDKIFETIKKISKDHAWCVVGLHFKIKIMILILKRPCASPGA